MMIWNTLILCYHNNKNQIQCTCITCTIHNDVIRNRVILIIIIIEDNRKCQKTHTHAQTKIHNGFHADKDFNYFLTF